MRHVRYLVIIFLLLCFGFPVFSDSIVIGTGNDKWSYGTARNDDDRLTFNFALDASFKDYFLSLDAEAFTNRGITEGDNTYKGRYDLLTVLCGYSFKPEIDLLKFTINPSIGMSYAGNIGLDKIQNLNHKLKNIPEIDLPYEHGTTLRPLFALYVDFALQISQKTEWLRAGIYGDYSYSPGFEFKSESGLKVSVFSGETEIAHVSAGYGYIKNYSNWKTQQVMTTYNNSTELNFMINAGLLQMDGNIKSKTGYATYSFDVMSFFREKTFKESSFKVNHLLSRFLKTQYTKAELLFDLNNRFSVYTGSSFFIGNYDFEEASRNSGRLDTMFVGVAYNFDSSWSDDWVKPYVAAGFGLGFYVVVELNDSISKTIIKQSKYIPLGEITVGASLLPEGLVVFDNASYSLKTEYSLVCINKLDEISGILQNYPNIHKPKQFESVFSVGIEVDFDI